MNDIQQNLEAKIERLETKLVQLNNELARYKMIEHANCGCTNFCYEKENSKEAREIYDRLYANYLTLKEENTMLKKRIEELENGN